MLKKLQRTLAVSALISCAIAANGQSFNENFQSWELTNYKNVPADDATGTCDPATDPATTLNTPGNGFVPAPIPGIEKSVSYGGLSVKYTITNGGVSPKCSAKSAYSTTTSPGAPVTEGVSVGYVSINKAATGTAVGTVGGSFQTSLLPKVDTLHVSLSATGTAKIAKISTSTDGTKWTPLLPYAAAPVGNSYPSDKTGTVYDVIVNLTNIMVKIESFTDVIRIHDFGVHNGVPTGISEDLLSIGSSVAVSDQTITVTSTNSGHFEIINQEGVVIAQRSFSPNATTSVYLHEKGIYIIRILSNNGAAVKKLAIY